MIDFSTEYDNYLKIIESTIAKHVTEKEPKSLYSPFKYIMSNGGKRIRPVLTMICCGSVGGDPKNASLIGTAIEILHNFTLVHDDIMDRSPFRRGNPTIHNKWDEPTAILAGDVMVGVAYELLPKTSDHERSQNIKDEFTKALIEVCEGQAYDMTLSEKSNITMEDYFNMIEKKTARLLEACAVIGGHCGLGTEEQIENLRLFARNLGLAFQLQDDLLDISANQQKFGKKIGQDIIEGKPTYLILKTLEQDLNSEERDLFQKFTDEKGLDESYIGTVQNIFDKYGILTDTQEQIEKYLNSAYLCLEGFESNDSTLHLHSLINKLNNRSH